MRLLNVNDLTLRNFPAANLPKYAIISHRWIEHEEASIRDVEQGLDLSKSGHRKVKDFAEYVKDKVAGVDWVWIDTCCINQDSSQEVSEAVNSMFKWYLHAEVCFAYLADVTITRDMRSLSESVWFLRGWTLQELLAPTLVIFLTQDWEVIGHKGPYRRSRAPIPLNVGQPLTSRIATITKIPEFVLEDWTNSQHFSANARLEWAAGRETTKEEDKVYCMLGIFGVFMTTIYGEGRENASKRLRKAVAANGEHLDETNNSSWPRCVSIPYTTLPTFVERAALTKELHEKIQNARISQSPPMVAVTGASGVGKTQLALHYVDMHRQEYDTVLWIDATSTETVSLSCVRCCLALSIPLGSSVRWDAVKDAPGVSALLQWLGNRSRNDKWLAIVDGADEFTWDVQGIIPGGRAGVVVVTSQLSSLDQLLPVKTSSVNVPTSMSTAEGVLLLYKSTGQSMDSHVQDVSSAAERIVRRLDKHPFSIDLAGGVIKTNAEDSTDLGVFMRQYLTDSAGHREVLQGSEKYIRASSTSKAIWIAWDTTMSFLKTRVAEFPGAGPVQILRLLTLFDKYSIQDEVLRLAASGLAKTSQNFPFVPRWLRQLLAVNADGGWDDSCYRAAIKALKGCHLIRQTADSHPGVTMHRLVQWQIERQGHDQEVWDAFLILVGAACWELGCHNVGAAESFEPYLVIHLPSNREVLEWRRNESTTALGWVSLSVGQTWQAVHRYKIAADLFAVASKELARTLGDDDHRTLEAMSHLASMHNSQGQPKKAEALQLQVVERLTRTLGEEHMRTIRAIESLSRTYRDQGLQEEAAKLQSKSLEARKKIRGERNLNTLEAMLQLSLTYREGGRVKEADQLARQAIDGRRSLLGDWHPETLNAIASRALICWQQGDLAQAKRLRTQAIDGFTQACGKVHPLTVAARVRLKRIVEEQPRASSTERVIDGGAGLLSPPSPRNRDRRKSDPGHRRVEEWLGIPAEEEKG